MLIAGIFKVYSTASVYDTIIFGVSTRKIILQKKNIMTNSQKINELAIIIVSDRNCLDKGCIY